MTRRTVWLIVLPISLILIAVALLWETEPPPVLDSSISDLACVAPSSRGDRPVDVLRAGMSVSAPPTATAPPVAPSPITPAAPVRASLGVFRTSGYTDCDAGMDCRGITASGERTRPGVVAVDPRIIPLRTVIQIDGMGEFVVLDTGGSIQGKRIDIWFASRAEALRHGVQSREVWRD